MGRRANVAFMDCTEPTESCLTHDLPWGSHGYALSEVQAPAGARLGTEKPKLGLEIG